MSPSWRPWNRSWQEFRGWKRSWKTLERITVFSGQQYSHVWTELLNSLSNEHTDGVCAMPRIWNMIWWSYLMYRESRENCSLLKEEVEGLRKKLERMEKMKEDLINMELEKNVKSPIITIIVKHLPEKQHFTLNFQRMAERIQAWENLGQSTGLNIRWGDHLKLHPSSDRQEWPPYFIGAARGSSGPFTSWASAIWTIQSVYRWVGFVRAWEHAHWMCLSASSQNIMREWLHVSLWAVEQISTLNKLHYCPLSHSFSLSLLHTHIHTHSDTHHFLCD